MHKATHTVHTFKETLNKYRHGGRSLHNIIRYKVNTHLIDVFIDECWGNNAVFGYIFKHCGHVFPLNELQLSGVVATAGQSHGGEGVPVTVVLLSGLVVEK